MITFLKLTENDKRLLIALLLILILLFVIFGYLGLLVKKIMKKQGDKGEDLIHDVVKAGVIKSPRKLVLFGIRKNYRQLFKDAWIPFCIMLVSSLILILYCAFSNNWGVNVFDYEKYGIRTLFFVFDWEHAPRANFFGMELISNWPDVLSAPHWSNDAIASYFFVPGMLVGGIWFLVCVQAYIARTYRIYKKSKTIFNRSLDNFDASDAPVDEIKPE